MSSTISLERKFALVPEWVIDLKISNSAFRLYAILARYADYNTHRAFPSRETLAERMGASVKTVERAVAELQEVGAIKRENRGRYHSNIYTLVMDDPQGTKMSPDKNVPGEDKNVPRGDKNVRRGDKDVALTRTIEQELKNKKDIFDQFWNLYPKKADKRKAEKALEGALKRATLSVILDGVEKYRDDPNRKPEFTKNPASWLNADAWDNDLLPQREVLNDWGKPFAPAAEGPGKRQWVRSLHDQGEHWECRPGEFDCK